MNWAQLIRRYALVTLALAMLTSAAPARAASPPLFGTAEIRNDNLAPMTHWTGMIERMRRTPEPFADVCEAPGDQLCHLKQWNGFLDGVKGLDPRAQLDKVNAYMNQFGYIDDITNWGRANYWEAPLEFLHKSGDCKDYAIAKYMSLRYLGWPVDALRLVVVRDMNLSADHAVLAVYVGDQILILDNQIRDVTNAASIHHYRPYYSINEAHWWFHH
ncbi:MAG TPA: transglutaminase-like cysteine peptidase [Stellaceae bacterium]|nr:transglutaminase-like cysteine peptidase [Stellaceae bacterium]